MYTPFEDGSQILLNSLEDHSQECKITAERSLRHKVNQKLLSKITKIMFPTSGLSKFTSKNKPLDLTKDRMHLYKHVSILNIFLQHATVSYIGGFNVNGIISILFIAHLSFRAVSRSILIFFPGRCIIFVYALK